MITITLEKTVTHGDESVEEIKLREMKMEDIYEIGYPYVLSGLDGEIEIVIKPKIIAKYISKLGNVPPSVVKQITFQDLTALQGAIMGFLGRSETDQGVSSKN